MSNSRRLFRLAYRWVRQMERSPAKQPAWHADLAERMLDVAISARYSTYLLWPGGRCLVYRDGIQRALADGMTVAGRTELVRRLRFRRLLGRPA